MQTVTTKIPKCKTVAQAIDLDNALEYVTIPKEFHKKIVVESKVNDNLTYDWEGYHLDESITAQIARYTPRIDGSPKLVIYDNRPVKAVSSLFQRIPLQSVWEAATKQLGEPISEQATNQAIIAQFDPIRTKYTRSGEITAQDYEIRATIAFSYNFAERSFMLGFVAEAFFCTNQMFVFDPSISVKVVHNVYHMKGFDLKDSINSLVGDRLKTLESKIEEAQSTALQKFDVLPYYWKSSGSKGSYLAKVWDQHQKNFPQTIWDAAMNLTWVSTHQTQNYGSAVDMSSKAGKFLVQGMKLHPDDYVRALGWYMQKQRETARVKEWSDRNWLDEIGSLMKPLKTKVGEVIAEKYLADPDFESE